METPDLLTVLLHHIPVLLCSLTIVLVIILITHNWFYMYPKYINDSDEHHKWFIA